MTDSNEPQYGSTPPPSGPPAYGAVPYGSVPPSSPPPPTGAVPYAASSYGSIPPPPGYGTPVSPQVPKKKRGALIAGLVALGVVAIGGGALVVNQLGGDDPIADEREDEDDEDDEDDEEQVVSTTAEAATTVDVADGSVAGAFVRVEALGAIIPDEEIQMTLQRIGQNESDSPVSTSDDVLNLCAAIPVESAANARVEWSRDNSPVSQGVSRRMEPPADGNCINNNGEPLEAGSYEVFFVDDAGGESTIALFTVGSAARSQVFVNDTGGDLCAIETSPTTAGFYQRFELTSGDPLADGDIIVVDVADVEHDARGVDCDENALDSFFFVPSDDVIAVSDGSVIEPVPETTTPPAQITDLELAGLTGVIGSLDVPVASDLEELTVLEVLLDVETDVRVATTDPSLALCVGWSTPGPLAADIVWEFNRGEVARVPVEAVDGVIGACVPPGGAAFDEGAYQAYLQRDDVISPVQTFTVGRAQTQLAFINDTGVEICEVGFSPNLTNFYTFYDFGASDDFGAPLAPGEGFTIAAPFIENDIKARDCAGEDVSEAFDIAPTDQTLSLTTGLA